MRIKRVLINAVVGDMDKVKTLALAIHLKCTLKNSRLEHFTFNRLAEASGVPYKTIKKYIPKLAMMGLFHLEGMHRNTVFVVNSLSSKTSKRNFDIKILKLNSYGNIKKSLKAFLVMHLESKKDYMRHTLSSYHNPQKSTNFKAVRRNVKKLVHLGFLKDMRQEYVENGLSLKRIAKELGCSVVTALKAVDYAINNGWLIRHKHYIQYYAEGVYHMNVPWATFSTKNNIYVIQANTYELTSASLQCFPWLLKAV